MSSARKIARRRQGQVNAALLRARIAQRAADAALIETHAAEHALQQTRKQLQLADAVRLSQEMQGTEIVPVDDRLSNPTQDLPPRRTRHLHFIATRAEIADHLLGTVTPDGPRGVHALLKSDAAHRLAKDLIERGMVTVREVPQVNPQRTVMEYGLIVLAEQRPAGHPAGQA